MARSTMAAIFQDLRDMTQTAPGDWTLGAINYWDDDQLQRVLDANQMIIYNEPIRPLDEYSGGTLLTKRYPTGFHNLETSMGGTAVFTLVDGSNAVISGTAYAVDYRNGLVTFHQNTGGAVYYLAGYAYNLNRAAAAIWRIKADYYATAYDVSTDNHSLKRSQLMAQCEARAARYEQLDAPSSVYAERGDN